MAEGKKAPRAVGTAREEADKKAGKFPCTAAKESETKFTKEQLLKAERFTARRDLVDALLDAGALYSLEDVEHRMDNYMKGRVK